MNNVLPFFLMQSEGGGNIHIGTGTYSDPYNWYGILDPNRKNGCHTKPIIQNEEEGWILVFLEEGIEYSIGTIGVSYNFDEYIHLYNNTRDIVKSNDDDYGQIDGVQVESLITYTPYYTGTHFIKISSYGNGSPNETASVHCYPAPKNITYENGDTTPHNLTSNDSDWRYTVSQSSDLDVREAYMAMDGKLGDEGHSHTNYDSYQWWQIIFNEGPVQINSFTITQRTEGNDWLILPWYLEAGPDGYAWQMVYEITDINIGPQESNTYIVQNSPKYQYWRVFQPEVGYLVIGEIQFNYTL